jgi:hypothetical protein
MIIKDQKDFVAFIGDGGKGDQLTRVALIVEMSLPEIERLHGCRSLETFGSMIFGNTRIMCQRMEIKAIYLMSSV